MKSPVGSSISVLNLMEVVTGKDDASGSGLGASSYFHALCRQSFPGPLTGGSASTKELNRWIDERISKAESPDMDYRKADVLKLLLSLLKISCQYYGKLRSSFGSDPLKVCYFDEHSFNLSNSLYSGKLVCHWIMLQLII